MEEHNNKNIIAAEHTDPDYIRSKRELKSVLIFFTSVTIFLIITYFVYEQYK
ncbi:hypothetical protein Back11_00580 [Paenibacillus baekrokdamisoli]|uniref:Uncharacterized protein n=1 Tax=Paenibacillus baekrokdamisoli TaxID=1712516 RepID=A0A3G9J210_9BACL|nr:hypothetical protein [Paenibacillus baekrokdamisoli]MBB3069315.1 hypothetical protein [Paenibacillus baekrokdamisoli]BBH18713.1 hypothetical protein Back11_00580 [Paenibacillus baekrokdamisoli]